MLRSLQARGVLSPLDRHFAGALARMAEGEDPSVLLAAALASRAVQHGHVCVDLARVESLPLVDAAEQCVGDVAIPALGDWCAALLASELVGDGSVPTPLVFEAPGRLYLYRYARYQRQLAEHVRSRVDQIEDCDGPLLRAGLERLFGVRVDDTPDLQRRAAAIAVQRRFAVISGGPGTGKTTTVVRILALVQEQAIARGGEPLRVLLLAPTGKAAQRLGDAIEGRVAKLDCGEAIAQSIPVQASTIHRALGWQPRTPTRFRHDAEHPLAADLVLVDEASMVDLALMAKLVAAVPPDGRLILLGDRDQLASVEAGAIFGDICGGETEAGYSQEFAATTEQQAGEVLPVAAGAAGIRDCIVHLTQSYRYRAGSGIDRVARAVNDGAASDAVEVLRGAEDGVKWFEGRGARYLRDALGEVVLAGCAGLAAGRPEERLACLERFRILCAHRGGSLGVEEVNATVEGWLRDEGVLRVDGEWYDGRPIMVVRNDYQLGLFNGDVGVVAIDDDGHRRAFFASDGEVRSFVPARLPPHETVFATTVHKSQGSEFAKVALILPEEVSPVLTRELLYTGITRAREELLLLSPEPVLRAAVGRRVERASGLREALWKPGAPH